MKIYITQTTDIGSRCADWAKKNLPPEAILVEKMEDSEIFFSIFYNQLIPQEFINSRMKCFNFHGGLLPEYRGSGTINWAIINGEKETGVTLHEIDEKIDHGPVIDVRRIAIDENDTAGAIHEKMEGVIFEMFKDWFAKLVSLDYVATPQDHSRARLYLRSDLQRAKDLTGYVRAFEFPGKEPAYYFAKDGSKIYLRFDNKSQ